MRPQDYEDFILAQLHKYHDIVTRDGSPHRLKTTRKLIMTWAAPFFNLSPEQEDEWFVRAWLPLYWSHVDTGVFDK